MSSSDTLKFAEFELDIANHELRRNGVAARLSPQPFRVLLLLVERNGMLVRREELRQLVWGDETVVDFEHGLNTCIRHIRQALGDGAAAPRFVQTVPRLGYKFTADVVAVPQHAALPATLRKGRWMRAAATIVVAVLGITLAGWGVARKILHANAARFEAHDLFLRGHLTLQDATHASAQTALELFGKALDVDATYARVHAAVAEVYLQKPSSIPGVPPTAAAAKARAAVERALALDEFLPDAHLAAGKLWMTVRDWPAAGREFRRAIELAPRHATAREQYAMWLSYQERFDEALKEARLAEALDPLSPAARNSVAAVLRHARRFDEAFSQAQRVLELNPNFGRAHAVLAQCYMAQGKFDAAIEEFRRSGASDGVLGYVYAAAGRTSEAHETLQALEKRYAATQGGPGEIGQVYLGLHDFDRAFKWLSRAVEDGSLWTLRVAVVFDAIRSDPRFDDLLRKSGYGE